MEKTWKKQMKKLGKNLEKTNEKTNEKTWKKQMKKNKKRISPLFFILSPLYKKYPKPKKKEKGSNPSDFIL